MTEQGISLIQFASDFADFEQNRMYPMEYGLEEPPHFNSKFDQINCPIVKFYKEPAMRELTFRKESAMRKLTIDHVSAIARAERDVVKGIVPNMSPHHRQAIEDDLERLAETKKSILDSIFTPSFPLKTDVTEDLI